MKRQAITFGAMVEPGNALLFQVFGTLRELPAPPESFVWSYVIGTDEGRVWMVISDDEPKVSPRTLTVVSRIEIRRVTARPAPRDSSFFPIPPHSEKAMTIAPPSPVEA